MKIKTFSIFFFNDSATTEIYTLSLHDALPFSLVTAEALAAGVPVVASDQIGAAEDVDRSVCPRSEEHTSELQSRGQLVCRLLLEKKKREQETKMRKSKKKYTKTRT